MHSQNLLQTRGASNVALDERRRPATFIRLHVAACLDSRKCTRGANVCRGFLRACARIVHCVVLDMYLCLAALLAPLVRSHGEHTELSHKHAKATTFPFSPTQNTHSSLLHIALLGYQLQQSHTPHSTFASSLDPGARKDVLLAGRGASCPGIKPTTL